MYCPNWGTKSMAWWKTPVTLLLVQPRSQESCNKPMISINLPTCYRTMTNFNSWEPCKIFFHFSVTWCMSVAGFNRILWCQWRHHNGARQLRPYAAGDVCHGGTRISGVGVHGWRHRVTSSRRNVFGITVPLCWKSIGASPHKGLLMQS